jgi:hypothetical protein
MTAKKAQGQGLGKKITRRAYELTEPEYFSMRTQNPAEVLSIKNTFVNSLFAPFDIDYPTDSQLHSGLHFMRDILDMGNFNSQTGLCIGFYGERVGDYRVNMQNPKTSKIDEQLAELGLDRNRGDAVFMMGRVGPESELKRSGVIYLSHTSSGGAPRTHDRAAPLPGFS